MTEFAVLDHKAEQFDLVIEVMTAEKMGENEYHLIALNGQLCGTLTNYDDQWEFHNTIESDGDRHYSVIPDEVVEGFLEDVEVVEK